MSEDSRPTEFPLKELKLHEVKDLYFRAMVDSHTANTAYRDLLKEFDSVSKRLEEGRKAFEKASNFEATIHRELKSRVGDLASEIFAKNS